MIESIITDYLRQNRRLVIPELGAFLKKEEGETIFVPFLNKDDGVLNGLVRQIYGASAAEAEGIISNYVKNIRMGIESKGSYQVSPLGSLKQDANGVLFLDTTDLNPQPFTRKTQIIVEEAFPPEPDEGPDTIEIEEIELVSVPPPPIASPEPKAPEEIKTVAETLDAPKTLNDLIREKQEHQEPAQTIHSRAAESIEMPKAVKRPVKPAPPAQKKSSADLAKKEKKGDIILIAAIVIAVIAVIAMIYAYAVIDLPLFNLQ